MDPNDPAAPDAAPEVAPDPVAVPHTEISADALQALVESFVLREGTDYGEHEFSLPQKVAHVMRQLERGEAQVMFDPQSESVTIVVVASNQRVKPRA
jgi:uncharacterized protein YheU (UPF0270 family)